MEARKIERAAKSVPIILFIYLFIYFLVGVGREGVFTSDMVSGMERPEMSQQQPKLLTPLLCQGPAEGIAGLFFLVAVFVVVLVVCVFSHADFPTSDKIIDPMTEGTLYTEQNVARSANFTVYSEPVSNNVTRSANFTFYSEPVSDSIPRSADFSVYSEPVSCNIPRSANFTVYSEPVSDNVTRSTDFTVYSEPVSDNVTRSANFSVYSEPVSCNLSLIHISEPTRPP